MPNRVRVLTVPDNDRAELERRARDRAAPARVAERARIVQLAADGLTGPQIAERVGCTEPTVIKWRRQYAGAGLAGLEDAPPGPAADGADRDGDQRDPVGDRDPAAGCFAGSRADALVEPGGWQSGCAAPAGSRSAMTRSPACGGGSASSPIGPTGSSSLPIRSWRPRLPTWSACTSTGERGGDLRRGDWGCRLDLIRAPRHDGQRRRGAARAPRLAARAARTRHPGLALPPPVGHDLYVSLTRTTHRLTVVYESDLPACLHRLAR